jgi:hypothetical protein
MEQTLERWQCEKTAAYLSDAVARAERDPKKRRCSGRWPKPLNSRPGS